jgi:exosortase E/protease (VPEID-CTERM system)
MFIAGRFQWFVSPAIRRPIFNVTPEIALLVPFVVLMATVLVTSAFLSSHFDYLYPARVVLVGLAIIWSWKYLDLSDFHLSLEPVLVGLAVALLWILMSPADNFAGNATNRDIHHVLAGLSGVMGSVWVVFRILGSILIAPIVEEFALRGYLLAKLSGSSNLTKGRMPFVLWAVVASSVSFGVLHESWLAGITAGLAYALVRLRTVHLGHAITAHAITNLAICIYALISGNWSAM